MNDGVFVSRFDFVTKSVVFDIGPMVGRVELWLDFEGQIDKAPEIEHYLVDADGNRHRVNSSDRANNVSGNWMLLPCSEEFHTVKAHRAFTWGGEDDGHWGPHSED